MAQNEYINEQLKYPVQYVQTLIGGTAHVILFNDGKKYVVKWYGARNRGKEVVNEYVIGKLAQLLELPVIPFELLYIPEEFIQKTPELKAKKHNFRAGYHYGCVYLENSIVFEKVRKAPPSKTEVVNRDMLAGLMLFDQWVNNSDRGTLNVILERQGDRSYYVHMIDHGRCFPGRYEWSTQTLNEKPRYNYHWPFYRWSFSLLNDHYELTSFAEKIINLPNESIYEIITSFPQEWNVNNDERQALYHFLLKQKNELPEIVASIIDYHSRKKKRKG